MAIYHLSAKIISRSKGQSAISSAAYRSGDKLYSERYNETKFYRRDIQPVTFILKPTHAPDWCLNRERLWNEVENYEKSKNAQLSREFNVALPVELSDFEQEKLTLDYCQKNFVDLGMVADISIHRDDEMNPHFHVMLTTRPFDENGNWDVKSRKIYINDEEGNPLYTKSGYRQNRKANVTDWDSKERMQKWRENWATMANHYLKENGINQTISEKSYANLGEEKQPTIHEGFVAREMEAKGKNSDRIQINKEIKESNAKAAIVYTLKKDAEEIKETETIVRSLSPTEKKEITRLSKELKTYISFDQIEDKKRMLNNWSNSARVNNLFKEDTKTLNLIESQMELVEKADSLILKESERLLEHYYPTIDQKNLSDYQVKTLANRTVKEDRVIQPEEVEKILEHSNQQELYHEVSKVVKRPYDSYSVYEEKNKLLNQTVVSIVEKYQVDFKDVKTVESLPDTVYTTLKNSIKEQERNKIAMKVIQNYYDDKISRIFPSLELDDQDIPTKELFSKAIDYYGDQLTVDNLIHLKERPLIKFTLEEQHIAVAYFTDYGKAGNLNNDESIDVSSLTMSEELKTILIDRPDLHDLLLNECIETGVLNVEQADTLKEQKTSEFSFSQQKSMPSSQLLNYLFRPQQLDQILASLDYEEREKLRALEKELKKKKPKRSFKGPKR